MDFDTFWKFEAVKIAAMEQLEAQGFLSLDKLFIRAKDIYNGGYENSLKSWESFWVGKEKTENKPVEKQIDNKTCPKCGETVPYLWKEHKYKTNGEPCGYVF